MASPWKVGFFIFALFLAAPHPSWQKLEAVFQGQCTHLNPCEHRCINQVDSTFECACFEGYELSHDGASCREIRKTGAAAAHMAARGHVNLGDPEVETDYLPVDDMPEPAVVDDARWSDITAPSDGDTTPQVSVRETTKTERSSSSSSSVVARVEPTDLTLANATRRDVTLTRAMSPHAVVRIDSALPQLIFASCDELVCDNGGRCVVAADDDDNDDDVAEPVARCQCPLGSHGQFCQHRVVIQWPRFAGDSVLQFPVLENSCTAFNVTVAFRPEALNGVLLYGGEHYDLTGDFFMIGLRAGKVEFRFDCGSGVGIIRAPKTVTLGQWNTVHLRRKGVRAWLSVNDGEPIYGKALGSHACLSVQEKLHLGGAADFSVVAARLEMSEGIVGCVRDLIVNNHAYDLRPLPRGEAVAGVNVEECSAHVCDTLTCRNGGMCMPLSPDAAACECPLGHHGQHCEHSAEIHVPSFDGTSYLRYHGLENSALSFLEMEIAFKPYAPDGVILYNGNPREAGAPEDFILLTMTDGYLEFRCDLGTGQAKIRSMERLDMDQWHTVHVMRTGRDAILQIDNQSRVEVLLRGGYTELSLHGDLYIGGTRSKDDITSSLQTLQNFYGCIQKVSINGVRLRLIQSALVGVNVANCLHPCAGEPCLNGGVCNAEKDSYTCDCRLGFTDYNCEKEIGIENLRQASAQFTGRSYLYYTREEILSRIAGKVNSIQISFRTKASNGLLLWSGQEKMFANSDFLFIGIMDGHLEFGYNLGSGVAIIRDNSTWVGDGAWHTVKAIRTSQEGSLVVDMGRIASAESPGRLQQLDINTGLYVGGSYNVEASTLRRYNQGFSGCISSIILGSDLRVMVLKDASIGWNVDQCAG
ncbi:PREDICTED: pikachurin-like [Priapulus caudatus]|uniref:Pikachurin-like n=1 Tax=Priapulus caudatus TaxID=37621 RepID=A0ABM1E5L6_PRICU|nr:PREDICTED: pikachurin-like [Priapulus caudatus]